MRTYNPDAQTLLATWAVKTALVSGSKHKPPTPETFSHDFYAAQEPPDKTLVWLMATRARTSQPWIIGRSIEPARRGEDCEACQRTRR